VQLSLLEVGRRILHFVLVATLLLAASLPRPAWAQEGPGGSGGQASQGGQGGQPPVVAQPVPPVLPVIEQVSPVEVVRGSRVVITAAGLPTDKSDIAILLGDIDIGAPVEFEKAGPVFIVPELANHGPGARRVPFGSSLVRLRVRLNGNWSEPLAPKNVAAAYIHITRDAKPPELKLTRVDPAFIPLAQGFSLIGEGMIGSVDDYLLLLDDREIKLCSEQAKTCDGGLRARLASARQLKIEGKLPPEWDGSHKLGLRVGDVTSESPLPVRFIPQDVESIKRTAIGWSLLLLGLVLALAMFGPGRYNMDAKGLVENSIQRFGVFLLDRNTDTYSLSALQFYLWTFVAVFAYSYLTISRILCQGVLELADIPENLPGILAVSAGAAVFSVGITSQKGPKGAGDVHPSLRDLISTGGVVQPERVQMLCWTFVAVGSFLLSVLRSDPTNVSTLPGIPERLLFLTGVSAAGYLGGKLARSAGPVIDEIRASLNKADPSKIELDVLGRGLDVGASFEIDGTPLDSTYIGSKPGEVPQAIVPPGATDSAAQLHLKLLTRAPTWTPGAKLKLTIVNRDGQRATWPFEVPASAPPPPAPPAPGGNA